MMDPLSFTASILTVIGTAGVIGKGLSKIIALRRAPDILLALNNEVADLYCVVQAVDHLIREHSETTHAAAITNLCRALEKAQTTLFKLEDLIRDGITTEYAWGTEEPMQTFIDTADGHAGGYMTWGDVTDTVKAMQSFLMTIPTWDFKVNVYIGLRAVKKGEALLRASEPDLGFF